jgi:hypothetical protein
MILEPADRRWQEVRTFVVLEADAVVALMGGKGTSDCIQKAVLASKPVFPIPSAGGAARVEWERLRAARYSSIGQVDLEFLADRSLGAQELATAIARHIATVLAPRSPAGSRRVFVVQGHDATLKNELARLLEKLAFEPIILAEQPEKGQDLLSKLCSQLTDVGFGFVLLTPDDVCGTASPGAQSPRARQTWFSSTASSSGYSVLGGSAPS